MAADLLRLQLRAEELRAGAQCRQRHARKSRPRHGLAGLALEVDEKLARLQPELEKQEHDVAEECHPQRERSLAI
ncbi:MAG: hypothetical protein DME86_07055 [Verrucomicrobia bacterium]|nr:MAG: hypothetical protein DME86_07055 [Verrucomicrobiota bacterium]